MYSKLLKSQWSDLRLAITVQGSDTVPDVRHLQLGEMEDQAIHVEIRRCARERSPRESLSSTNDNALEQ